MFEVATSSTFLKIFFSETGRHWALRFWRTGQFFFGHFGNFNLEIRYCVIFRTSGMRCFITLDGILTRNYSPSLSVYFEPFTKSDRKRVSYFLLVISPHANECYLFCLSDLNRKFTNS